MGFLDGNNALGNWFYNKLQSNVNNDPYLRNEVYNAGRGSTTAAMGSVFKLPELGISEAQAAPLPAGQDGGGGGGGGAGGGGGGGAGGGGDNGANPTGEVKGTSDNGGNNGGGGTSIDPLVQRYINDLNYMYGSMEPEIETQKTLQDQMVGNSYDQSVKDLQANTADSKQNVMSNQVKTLKDLANNLKNQYMAGNVYLGARGAGDSSAANMYSYALAKSGSKSRGDVLSQTNASLAKIDNIYTQEKSRLDTDKTNNLLSIANWYSQAKQQLAGLKGQDLASLSSTLLSNALNMLNTTQTNYMAKKGALEEWAMNNSTNISQLKTNLQNIASIMPSYRTLTGTPSVASDGSYYVPSGTNYSTDDWLKRLAGVTSA